MYWQRHEAWMEASETSSLLSGLGWISAGEHKMWNRGEGIEGCMLFCNPLPILPAKTQRLYSIKWNRTRSWAQWLALLPTLLNLWGISWHGFGAVQLEFSWTRPGHGSEFSASWPLFRVGICLFLEEFRWIDVSCVWQLVSGPGKGCWPYCIKLVGVNWDVDCVQSLSFVRSPAVTFEQLHILRLHPSLYTFPLCPPQSSFHTTVMTFFHFCSWVCFR